MLQALQWVFHPALPCDHIISPLPWETTLTLTSFYLCICLCLLQAGLIFLCPGNSYLLTEGTTVNLSLRNHWKLCQGDLGAVSMKWSPTVAVISSSTRMPTQHLPCVLFSLLMRALCISLGEAVYHWAAAMSYLYLKTGLSQISLQMGKKNKSRHRKKEKNIITFFLYWQNTRL